MKYLIQLIQLTENIGKLRQVEKKKNIVSYPSGQSFEYPRVRENYYNTLVNKNSIKT